MRLGVLLEDRLYARLRLLQSQVDAVAHKAPVAVGVLQVDHEELSIKSELFAMLGLEILSKAWVLADLFAHVGSCFFECLDIPERPVDHGDLVSEHGSLLLFLLHEHSKIAQLKIERAILLILWTW